MSFLKGLAQALQEKNERDAQMNMFNRQAELMKERDATQWTRRQAELAQTRAHETSLLDKRLGAEKDLWELKEERSAAEDRAETVQERQEAALKAYTERTDNSKAAREWALSKVALAEKIGDAEGGVEFLNSISPQAAHELMKEIVAAQEKGADIEFVGRNIIDNFTVFEDYNGDPVVTRPSIEELNATDWNNWEEYAGMMDRLTAPEPPTPIISRTDLVYAEPMIDEIKDAEQALMSSVVREATEVMRQAKREGDEEIHAEIGAYLEAFANNPLGPEGLYLLEKFGQQAAMPLLQNKNYAPYLTQGILWTHIPME